MSIKDRFDPWAPPFMDVRCSVQCTRLEDIAYDLELPSSSPDDDYYGSDFDVST